jgi:hypothetical protein
MSHGGHGGKSFLNREHTVSDTGIDSIQSHDGISDGLFMNAEGLDKKDLLTLVTGLFLCRDDVPDNFRKNHGRTLPRPLDIIDDRDDRGLCRDLASFEGE